MKGKKGKSLLVRIDDAWVIRDDIDCLLNGDVQVNGAVSILTLLFALADVHAKYMPIFN